MKTRKIFPIILLAILLIVFMIYGWNEYHLNNESNTLKPPSKINLYYNGEQKEIVRNTNKGGQDVFKDIYELMVFQMPKIIGVDNSCKISNTEVEKIKAYAVEFIYNKPQKTTVNNAGNVNQIQYTEMLFSIGEQHEDNVYIKTIDNSYLFVGTRPNIKYLVKNIF